MAEQAKPAYSPGLEGVIAGESAICAVDPDAGLLYRGYDIHELAAKSNFEDVAYLLLQGELPSVQEAEGFREALAAERHLPQQVQSMLALMPRDSRPMDGLRTGISMLAAFDPDAHDLSHDANVRKAVRVIARTSTLITAGWRVQHGQEPFDPGGNVSHAARFLFALNGRMPDQEHVVAFNTILILYAEHDFNASTFAARVTASTLADLYAAITSALAALEGPLHGGANEEAMKVLRDIGTAERAEAWAQERLGRREKIMGFGHRVYRKGDSRVAVMREILRSLGRQRGEPQWVEICERLEEVIRREKGLCANVDLYAAPVLHLLGIPAALNTPIFACARAAGWCAHIIEQQDHNRLIRPRSIYTGPAPRPYPG